MVAGSHDKIDSAGPVAVRTLPAIFEKPHLSEHSGVVKEVESRFETGLVIRDDMEMLEDIVSPFVCEGA